VIRCDPLPLPLLHPSHSKRGWVIVGTWVSIPTLPTVCSTEGAPSLEHSVFKYRGRKDFSCSSYHAAPLFFDAYGVVPPRKCYTILCSSESLLGLNDSSSISSADNTQFFLRSAILILLILRGMSKSKLIFKSSHSFRLAFISLHLFTHTFNHYLLHLLKGFC